MDSFRNMIETIKYINTLIKQTKRDYDSSDLLLYFRWTDRQTQK